MGSLTTFDLKEYIDKYNIDIFIETGLGAKANGIRYASSYNFKKLYSVDIDKIYFDRALNEFKENSKIELHYKDSSKFLDEILPLDGNILFWLDAHFPDYHVENHLDTYIPLNEYKNKVPENIRMPLKAELEIICKKQDITNCVFIVDDYRCYEPESGNFGFGLHQNRNILGCTNDSSFFNILLSETHDTHIDRRHSGYFIATPKV